MNLTHNGVLQLYNVNSEPAPPVRLQCTGIKPIQNKSGGPTDRFKIYLSDGVHVAQFILASQLVNMVHNKEFKEGSVVDVVESVCNTVNETKSNIIVILIKINVVAHEVPTIGDPQLYNPNAGAAAPPPAAGSNVKGPYNNNNPGGGHPQQHPPPGNGPYGGGPPQGGPYGAPPPQGGPYGAPPQMAGGGMNQLPPQGPYGGAPPPGPYGAPPPNAGGGPPPGNPYGAPPPQQGPYGAPPPGNPYGAPPQQHGAPRPPMPQHNNPYGAPAGGPPPAMPPQYKPAGGGAIVRNEAPVAITDIDALNPYQNRWTIKGRVTSKSDIRRFTNARGEGKFFSFDMLDANGGEIRVMGWGDQCDRWFDHVHKGQVYMLSKAGLKNKRGNFNHTKHQYEIQLENGSVLEPVADEANIPQIRYQFVPIRAIQDIAQNTTVDVIGIVESVGDWSTIQRRDGTEAQKRSITIRDNSNASIEVTLWGGYVQDPGEQLQVMVTHNGQKPVLAMKSVRVGDYNGKTLSSIGSTVCQIDPVDEPVAGQLRSWYDSGGANEQAQAMSLQRTGGGRQDRRISLSTIKDEHLGTQGHQVWVTTMAYVAFIRSETTWNYPACPLGYNGKTCNKKLIDHGNGEWYCERCQQAAVPDYRFILSTKIQDHTGEEWATAFNEAAPVIMNTTAGEMKMLQETNPAAYDAMWANANFKLFVFKLNCKEDTYNDEMRVRTTIVRADPVDYTRESKWLIEGIHKLEQGQDPFAAPPAGPAAGGMGGHGGYGAPQGGGGFGGGGYGQYQQQQQPPQYGGQQGGYGGGGYNNQPPQQYGAPPPQGGGYGGPPPQQNWGPPQGGGFGGF